MSEIQKSLAAETEETMTPKSWSEFERSGMLWWMNRILHTFGWAIVIEYSADGLFRQAYPARMKWRGFPEDVEAEGFKRVSTWVREHAEEIEKEATEE